MLRELFAHAFASTVELVSPFLPLAPSISTLRRHGHHVPAAAFDTTLSRALTSLDNRKRSIATAKGTEEVLTTLGSTTVLVASHEKTRYLSPTLVSTTPSPPVSTLLHRQATIAAGLSIIPCEVGPSNDRDDGGFLAICQDEPTAVATAVVAQTSDPGTAPIAAASMSNAHGNATPSSRTGFPNVRLSMTGPSTFVTVLAVSTSPQPNPEIMSGTSASNYLFETSSSSRNATSTLGSLPSSGNSISTSTTLSGLSSIGSPSSSPFTPTAASETSSAVVPASPNSTQPHSSSTVLGVALGATAALAVVLFLVFCLLRRRKKHKSSRTQGPPKIPPLAFPPPLTVTISGSSTWGAEAREKESDVMTHPPGSITNPAFLVGHPALSAHAREEQTEQVHTTSPFWMTPHPSSQRPTLTPFPIPLIPSRHPNRSARSTPVSTPASQTPPPLSRPPTQPQARSMPHPPTIFARSHATNTETDTSALLAPPPALTRSRASTATSFSTARRTSSVYSIDSRGQRRKSDPFYLQDVGRW